jgi:hypothetical protein
MSRYKALWIGLVFLLVSTAPSAQLVRVDSVVVAKQDTSDYATKTHRDPRKATIRSAIIQGWGQIYNHKYWKAPIAWGGLITCALIFRYNIRTYEVYRRVYNEMLGTDTTWYHGPDSAYHIDGFSPSDVQYARNEVRQDVDYSALAFLLVWGLNVVDATVDAHLHEFDVSDKLTLRIGPGQNPSGYLGIGIILDIHSPRHKPCPLLTNHSY